MMQTISKIVREFSELTPLELEAIKLIADGYRYSTLKEALSLDGESIVRITTSILRKSKKVSTKHD